MTGSKMLFAGIRFFISGLIILAIAKPSHRKFGIRKPADAWFILLYSLLNTTLHYAFFYFGLSHNAGARSAILNSMCHCLINKGTLSISVLYLVRPQKSWNAWDYLIKQKNESVTSPPLSQQATCK